jgi:hypothetical protein
MASQIKTLGTSATTSLSALVAGALSAFTGANTGPQQDAADLAAIANAIKDDLNVAHPIMPTAWSQGNLLYVPNRGILKVLPGDYVAVDSQGWPILVSANSIANAAWTHS